jgi:hypothetical protein
VSFASRAHTVERSRPQATNAILFVVLRSLLGILAAIARQDTSVQYVSSKTMAKHQSNATWLVRTTVFAEREQRMSAY